MKLINSMFYFSLLITLFASCTKEVSKPNKDATEYFPNKVGNYWEYEIHDSLKNDTYNLKIEIIDSIRLSDGKYANIWKYSYPTRIELRYVRIESDSIKVYDSLALKSISYINYPIDLYVIPFSIGDGWKSNNYVIDTFFIGSVVDVGIGNKIYSNCFFISRKNIAYNYHLEQSISFKPYIGIIQFYQKEFDLVYIRRENWILKQYLLR